VLRTWANALSDSGEAPVHADRPAPVELCRKPSAGPDYASDVAPSPRANPVWAFLGLAAVRAPLPQARQAAVLDELLRIASR